MQSKFTSIPYVTAKDDTSIKDEHRESVPDGGGGTSNKKKPLDREALKAKVAAQLKQIRQFQDAFTSSNIDANELLNA